nr:MAG TPA: hypothetical protein [Caudoviricetes sp.]
MLFAIFLFKPLLFFLWRLYDLKEVVLFLGLLFAKQEFQ